MRPRTAQKRNATARTFQVFPAEVPEVVAGEDGKSSEEGQDPGAAGGGDQAPEGDGEKRDEKCADEPSGFFRGKAQERAVQAAEGEPEGEHVLLSRVGDVIAGGGENEEREVSGLTNLELGENDAHGAVDEAAPEKEPERPASGEPGGENVDEPEGGEEKPFLEKSFRGTEPRPEGLGRHVEEQQEPDHGEAVNGEGGADRAADGHGDPCQKAAERHGNQGDRPFHEVEGRKEIRAGKDEVRQHEGDKEHKGKNTRREE